MTTVKRKRAPGGGRKPAGDRGEKTSEYPGQMVRFPIETLAGIRALSKVRGVPLWRLMNEAAVALLAGLRGEEREETTSLVKREAMRLKAKRR